MSFRAIHQFVVYAGPDDAIGNQVLALQGIFRSWGYESEVFALVWHAGVAGEHKTHLDYVRFSHPDNLVLYHHAIGGDLANFVQGLPDRIVLYYHNITPAHFFYSTNREVARQLVAGRRVLAQFAGRTPAIAGSAYNGRELQMLGFHVLGVVPYGYALQQQIAADAAVSQALTLRYARPGSTDWLYVGRLAPNKRIEDVVKAFYYYHAWINPTSRLLLVGSGAGMEVYVKRLTQLIARMKLEYAVVITGPVEQTVPFYRLAQVYVSMSEHEGFCVPLLEAMHHGLPVVAYASSAVPETLGGAGVLITRKDHALIAEVVHEAVSNAELRERLVAGQRARLAAFTPAQAAADLRACLDKLERLPEALQRPGVNPGASASARAA